MLIESPTVCVNLGKLLSAAWLCPAGSSFSDLPEKGFAHTRLTRLTRRAASTVEAQVGPLDCDGFRSQLPILQASKQAEAP